MAEDLQKPPQLWTFKSNPAYQAILEHVSQPQGVAYLDLLRTLPEWTTYVEELVKVTARANDGLGEPVRADFPTLSMRCSPTNLRYAWQACALWHHINTLGLDAVHIIELGGGYGGLALFASRLAPTFHIDDFQYTIVDVAEASAMQKMFLPLFGLPIATIDGTDRQALSDLLNIRGERVFVSAYAYSEFSPTVREWYNETLVPFCPHGFLVWNINPLEMVFPNPPTIMNEPVLTGPGNLVIYY